MKIIVPMAGRGSRLRPHTLTTPKPLVKVAGKPIVQRLVEDLAKNFEGQIEEITFIIGDFGKEVEKQLKNIAKSLGAKGTVVQQKEPLGTAHAIYCAKKSLDGPIILAFADTLFQANFDFDTTKDGIIWVQKVKDPSAYGVIKLDKKGHITDFIEKPETFVSDLAIVGIYYLREGQALKKEIEYLLDNDIKDKGEYQLTNALENLKSKGTKFFPGKIDEWLDCGNKKAAVHANKRVLTFTKGLAQTADSAKITNSTIIQPCLIGEGVTIKDSVVGPHVTVGDNSKLVNSVIKNSLIGEHSQILEATLKDSMIGNKVIYNGKFKDLSIGDFTHIKE